MMHDPIEEQSLETTSPPPPVRRGGAAPWIVGGVLFASALAAGAWWYLGQRDAGPAAAPEALPSTPIAPSPGTEATPGESLSGSDDRIRALASGITAHELFGRWLETGDLARRLVAVLFNVSEGEVPRSALAILAPRQAFDVTEQGGRIYISEASFQRYDGVADVVASIDAQRAAGAWMALEPLFEAAHREIAPWGRTLRATLAGAIGHLLAAPIPNGEMEVREKGALFIYADPKLEALSPAQKQLLRMGPDNAERIQAKLRELRTALGLTTAAR